MTKHDLAKLYLKNGYSKSITEGCTQIDNFINVVHQALQSGQKISIHRFLSMQIVDKPGQNFVNPQTGKQTVLSPGKRIKISQTPGFRKLAETKKE